MKKLILMGPVGSGKTTLCQRLNKMEKQYRKTQAIEAVGSTLDTPGEYFEHRRYQQALLVSAIDADLVVFVQDATDKRNQYSPGHGDMFPGNVIGIVTKVDLAVEEEIEKAEKLLKFAGAGKIFRSPDPECRLEKYLERLDFI